MPHATGPSQGVIETTINYFNYVKELDAGLYKAQRANTAGYKRQKGDARPMHVTDVRGREDDFKIDTHGFQFVKGFDVPYEIWQHDQQIKERVYSETKQLLKRETGCSDVHIFNHILRRDPYQKILELPADLPDDAIVPLSHPAMGAHIDQTYRGASIILNNIPEADELAAKSHTRWGIINVWRPLKTVTREPLAICDARSVVESDLREITVRYDMDNPRGKEGPHYLHNYIWTILYNPEHEWYWPSNMTPEECLLIRCFDTKLDGRARRAPHSAIRTPNDNGPPRESIELRCLVFWEDQPHEGEEKQYICTGKDTWVPVEA